MKTAPEQTAAALLELLPRLMRFLHQGLRGHPLTLQQLRVLGTLADGERSAGEVAAELVIRPPTLTGLVTPLERQGLITRRRDPVAWRVVRLGLTPAGRDVYHSILVAARRRLVGLVADLPPPDQAALSRALLTLEAALQQSQPGPKSTNNALGGGGATEEID
jgi:DNA-binding MarR family transcriptional regulator